MTPELWVLSSVELTSIVHRAQEVERSGFTGLSLGDSQNRSGDTIVALTMAALATTSLRLSTGVTNPYTRHPAVLAGAFISLQSVSGGRVAVGLGRGDSALADLGLAPAPLDYFESYLRTLQTYLRGEDVAFGDLPPSALPASAMLELGDRPTLSRIRWIPPGLPKVPVEVAATGPRVIALAARLAERVTFAVGAEKQRLRWALMQAREARERAELDPDDVSYGAIVTVAVDDDPREARRLGGGILAVMARFSVMHGTINGPVTDEDRATLETLRKTYAMTHHAESSTPQDRALPDEFAHRFGIYGPPEYCAERLQELSDMGIKRLVLVPPHRSADPEGESLRRLGAEVIPLLSRAQRQSTSGSGG